MSIAFTRQSPAVDLPSNKREAAAGRVEKACASPATTAFGWPRNFLENRFVYTVISPRARGLSIGIDMNPDRYCNFDCIYCEVNRTLPVRDTRLNLDVMSEELERTLDLVQSGKIRQLAAYRCLNEDLLRLRHVALSGDGEPTLSPDFNEAVQVVVHMRARPPRPFFKMALITNGTGLDLPGVQDGLRYFTSEDEIWIKLDAGTQNYMNRVNRSEVSLEKVIANLMLVGRGRPVIVQSLFPLILDQQPPAEEIDAYIGLLGNLIKGGAQIASVQIYSATRPTEHSECGHLPLRKLSEIAKRIKAETGLRADVY